MKLFKKLTAIALAAVLALAMVGCGGNSLLNQVKDCMSDFAVVFDSDLVNSKELDDLTAKLIVEANNAAAKEENKDKDVMDILLDDEVLKAAKVEGDYVLSVVENYALVSSAGNESKGTLIASSLLSGGEDIGNPNIRNDFKYGVASGKIGEKEYVVMLKAALD